MTGHVDIIENHPEDDHQVLVAQVLLIDTRVVVVPRASDEYQHLERTPYRLDGRNISPTDEPQAYLSGLCRAMNGDYTFATEVHLDAECKFQYDKDLAFHSVSSHSVGPSAARSIRQPSRLGVLVRAASHRHRPA